MSGAVNNLFDVQEQICYVQCGCCASILWVNVPCNSWSLLVTVKCGHCSSLLSVNMMKASFVPLHLFSTLPNHLDKKLQHRKPEAHCENNLDDAGDHDDHQAQNLADDDARSGSSLVISSEDHEEDDPQLLPNQVVNKPPEKRQRAPSAYNTFIKEEIGRLKALHPHMTHRQAFSTAAKNWAHCPPSQRRGRGESSSNSKADRKMPTDAGVDEDEGCDNESSNCFRGRKALRHSIQAQKALLE